MGFRHYSDSFRAEAVNYYHNISHSITATAQFYHVGYHTMHNWLESDPRQFKRERSRLNVRTAYSFKFKIAAIKQVLQYRRRPVDVAAEVGVTFAMLYIWLRIYKTRGEYALMGKTDLKKGSAKSISSLEKYIEELEAENYQKQMQIDVYEATLKVLKNYPGLSFKENLSDLTNSIKTEAINELRPKYKLVELLIKFKLSKRTYHDQCKALARANKYLHYDAFVLAFIKSNHYLCKRRGYRSVMDELRLKGFMCLERRVRKVMQENDLLAYQTKSMRPHNSYKDDGQPAAPNYLYDPVLNVHYFRPASLWEILGTDVTEMHINGFKVFFSVIIDFFDSMPVAWRIGRHPDTDLIVGTVEDLVEKTPEDRHFVLHMDRGSVNRSKAMVDCCKNNHILQSMSRKGKSGDNAPTEGFFGRLKQEWFNKTDFAGCTYDEVVCSLENYLDYYCNSRTQKKLGGISPIMFRCMKNLKLAA